MKFDSVSIRRARLALIAAGAAIAVTACVPQRQPEPQPQPAQRPAPTPTPTPLPPPPPAADWRDTPLTPGTWIYRNEGPTSQALFGVANSEAQFIVRCDRAARRVTLVREGLGNSMIVRTTSVARTLPVASQAEPLAYTSAALAPTDRLLDAMAFSRGRFTIEVPGTSVLVLPAWPEPARVVEDCRL